MTRPKLSVTIQHVPADSAQRWLAAGWRDLRAAPVVGLVYGAAFVIVSFALTWGLVLVGLGSLVLPLGAGFMLLSPVLVVGLYEVSRRMESGEAPGLRAICLFCLRNSGQLAAMGVVLMLFLLAWIQAAIFLFALFFNQGPPPLDRFLEVLLAAPNVAPFLVLGTLIGGVLATTIFAISAVSIPMLLDRDMDVVTAIAISLRAVLINWRVMIGWAAAIGLLAFVGLATFYIGLAIALPWLAFATWHAYRDLIKN